MIEANDPVGWVMATDDHGAQQVKVMEELEVLMRLPFSQLTPDQRAVVRRPGAFQDWKACMVRCQSGREEKEKEEKEEACEGFFALLLWPRSSSTSAVAPSLCWFSW